MGYYNSFVIRVWTEDRGRLHGKIEHVASQDSLLFIDLEPILEFVRLHLVPPADVLPETKDDSNDDQPNLDAPPIA